MRRFHTIFLAFYLACGAALPSSSATAQEDFFSELVTVSDRSDAELARAAQLGLSRLFVRVSGNEAIVVEPAFETAVRAAQEHVLLYSYRDVDDALVVFFEFDDAFVRGLFRDESVPYWEQRRPPVVAWVALDEPFSRRFAARSDDAELLTPAIALFEARGLELRFPLLDLTDAAAVPVSTIWSRDFDRVRAASRRYGSEYSLIGRWIELSDGSRLVDWYFVGPENQSHLQLRQSDVNALWAAGVDLATDKMRDSLAVTLQQFDTSSAIAVTVSGVASFADYRSVSAVFTELAQLVDLRIESTGENTLTYRVVGVSSAEEVARLIPNRSGLRVQSVLNREQLNLTWETIQ